MISDQTVYDLSKTSRDRVRKTLELTLQLLEDDASAVSTVMSVVAADLILYAASYIYRQKEVTETQALDHVMKQVMRMIDSEVRPRRRRKGASK